MYENYKIEGKRKLQSKGVIKGISNGEKKKKKKI